MGRASAQVSPFVQTRSLCPDRRRKSIEYNIAGIVPAAAGIGQIDLPHLQNQLPLFCSALALHFRKNVRVFLIVD